MRIAFFIYSLLIILAGIFLPVFQKYYLQDYFKYPLYITLILSFLGATIYLIFSLKEKNKKILRIAGIVLSFFIAFLINQYISVSNPIKLAALRERIHIFEYGVLSILFFHTFKNKITGVLIYFSALLYGSSIGLIDEFFQYLVVNRVGDLRDVGINALSVFTGTVFAFSLHYFPQKMKNSHIKKFFYAFLIFIFFLSLFTYKVNYGYLIKDPEIGEFKSKYNVFKLIELAYEKDKLWKIEKKNNPERFSKPSSYYSGKIIALEDTYFKEARLRTGKRNKFLEKGKYFKAYKENQILEKYYWPFLFYFKQSWTDVQKSNCLQKIKYIKNQYYISKALCFIYTGWLPKLLIIGGIFLSLFLLGISSIIKMMSLF